MASKKTTMYMEKQYELSEVKESICSKLKDGIDAELVESTEYILGETKILLLLFEKWYFRTGSYAGLSLLLTEYHECQSADIVSIGGKEVIFSLGAEDDFVWHAENALKALGFSKKVNRE